jgi:CRISPR-associated endonuclease/helicase Cas3
MNRYFAHSGKSDWGISAQSYDDHIHGVYKIVKEKRYILSPFLQKAVSIAAIFHDMGKLDDHIQIHLCKNDCTNEKLLNHVEAGVQFCLNEFEKTKDRVWVYAAYFIHSHHIGLGDVGSLFYEKQILMNIVVEIKDKFKDLKINNEIGETVHEYVSKTLGDLYSKHYSVCKQITDEVLQLKYNNIGMLTSADLRMAFSVLVTGDHVDTSFHYGNEKINPPTLRIDDRLKLLDSKILELKTKSLKNGISQEVVDSRNELFDLCSKSDVSVNRFYSCSAPVGKGKTFSLMKTALRICKEKQKDKIFFIIPFTNIINQSVNNYREFLVLPNEDECKVVNEIHSKVEFSSAEYRKYSQQWDSPVNVATAVQFFESLFSNKTSSVKKLHNFHNSVIVFDEYHTSIPHHLWHISLKSMKILSERYNVDFVFGSGTHVYYWDIFDEKIDVSELVSDETYERFKKYESERITFKDIGECRDDIHFYSKISKIIFDKKGKLKKNTLIVCNTIANAVSITRHFEELNQFKVYHVSSSLAPIHRGRIIDKIKKELKSDEKIMLVATSIIECGIDFSFEIGFREKASLMSTIQCAGRVNRNKDLSIPGKFYEFSFNNSFLTNSLDFSRNPSMSNPIKSRYGLGVHPDNCTSAIQNELDLRKKEKTELVDLEHLRRLKSVNDQFTVIPNRTVSVIIDSRIVQKMKDGKHVPSYLISRYSVSIYRNKIEPDGEYFHYVKSFCKNEKGVYYWVGPYDKEKYGIRCF